MSLPVVIGDCPDPIRQLDVGGSPVLKDGYIGKQKVAYNLYMDIVSVDGTSLLDLDCLCLLELLLKNRVLNSAISVACLPGNLVFRLGLLIK